MDGFKNTTKTRYFTRPNEGFGYAKGGEIVSRNDMAGGQGPMKTPAVVAKYAKGGKVTPPKVTGPKGVAKVGKVMGEYGKGELHSGSKSGPVVKNPKQAIAIALSEGRKASKMAMGGRACYNEGGAAETKDAMKNAMKNPPKNPPKIPRSMIENISSRPGPDTRPLRVDRLEGRETPSSVTVEQKRVTVDRDRNYRGRAGDIGGALAGEERAMQAIAPRSDLDRRLREAPRPAKPSSARDYIPDFMEPALERVGILGRKRGGLAVMPKGKKGKC